jgi:hypothetical protein
VARSDELWARSRSAFRVRKNLVIKLVVFLAPRSEDGSKREVIHIKSREPDPNQVCSGKKISFVVGGEYPSIRMFGRLAVGFLDPLGRVGWLIKKSPDGIWLVDLNAGTFFTV